MLPRRWAGVFSAFRRGGGGGRRLLGNIVVIWWLFDSNMLAHKENTPDLKTTPKSTVDLPGGRRPSTYIFPFVYSLSVPCSHRPRRVFVVAAASRVSRIGLPSCCLRACSIQASGSRWHATLTWRPAVAHCAPRGSSPNLVVTASCALIAAATTTRVVKKVCSKQSGLSFVVVPSKCHCTYFSLRGLGRNSLANNESATRSLLFLIQYPSILPMVNGRGPNKCRLELRDPQ